MFIFRIVSLFTIFMSVSLAAYAQDETNRKVDSLLYIVNHQSENKTRLLALHSLYNSLSNTDSVIKYSRMAYQLARKLDESELALAALVETGLNTYYSNGYEESLEYYFEALMLADSLSNEKKRMEICHHIANAYSMVGDTKSIDYYKEALTLATKLNDREQMLKLMLSMGQEFIDNGLYDEGDIYYRKALDEYSDIFTANDSSKVFWGLGYAEIGRSLVLEDDRALQAKHLDLARQWLLKSYRVTDMRNLIRYYSVVAYLSDLYIRLAAVSPQLGQSKAEILDSCRMFINKGLAVTKANDFANGTFVLSMSLVYNYCHERKFSEAKLLLDSLANMFEPDDESADIMTLAQGYAQVYDSLGDYKMANLYQKQIVSYYRTSNSSQQMARASRIVAEAEYERSQRQHEIDKMLADESARWRMAIIILLFVGLVYFVYSLSKSRKANIKLNMQNSMLEEQREEIIVQNESLESQKSLIEAQKLHLEAQNALITKANSDMVASLNYAQLIQQAAMPADMQMKALFADSMVYMKPLDIVSGDFYWSAKVGGCRMIAVGDCTGHGVPGGFLSMLGISLLNDIPSDFNAADISAGRMLDNMNTKFQQALRQSSDDFNSNHDGIDVALVIFEPGQKRLHYAGAFRPILIAGPDGVRRINADRWPIGAADNQGTFRDNIVEFSDGDALYLFSDGITDQFGYINGCEKKFGRKRLESFIADVWRLPMSSQQTRISLTMDRWRSNASRVTCEQLDDILLVGVRL